MNREIEMLVDALRHSSIEFVDSFERKLDDNSSDRQRVEDLLCEGYAALTFHRAGFRVTMSDRPDLWLHGVNGPIAAEVKHFRRKTQDEVDEVRLRDASRQRRLVVYGDARDSEGKSSWEQVRDVARSKAASFRGGHPYLLVLRSSSSHCVEDMDVRTAAHVLDDEARDNCDSTAARLSGLVFLSNGLFPTPTGSRNVFLFQIGFARHPVSKDDYVRLTHVQLWERF